MREIEQIQRYEDAKRKAGIPAILPHNHYVTNCLRPGCGSRLSDPRAMALGYGPDCERSALSLPPIIRNPQTGRFEAYAPYARMVRLVGIVDRGVFK